MSEVFAVDVSTINYHLKQIDESGEVHLSDAIRKIPIMSDKWDEQSVLLYNLDAIIAVGYRVNSYEATQFRIWARFLDLAEDRASRHVLMKMADWKLYLERYLQVSDRDILPDAGSVSHEEAEAKALGEYEKFWRLQDKTFLSDFDRFIEGLDKA